MNVRRTNGGVGWIDCQLSIRTYTIIRKRKKKHKTFKWMKKQSSVF